MGGFPRMKFDADINAVADGNSLTVGIGGSSAWPTQMKALAPMSGVGTITNCGGNGQTTSNMRSTPEDVDGAWVAGKKNLLLLWEGTNQIAGYGHTGQMAADEMAAYIADRKAVHVWNRIVLLTCLPRQDNTSAAVTVNLNARLDAYNDILRANYKTMGADMLIDVRQAGSPFNMADYAMQSFEDLVANSGLWASGETGNHIHLNNAGYGVIAQMVATGLRRLRR